MTDSETLKNTFLQSVWAWLAGFKVYGQPTVARMLALGFGAGLPLLLVLGTLSFWLREAGIDRKTIGFLSWIGLAYGFKWVWAPLVDRLRLPILARLFGQRRAIDNHRVQSPGFRNQRCGR